MFRRESSTSRLKKVTEWEESDSLTREPRTAPDDRLLALDYGQVPQAKLAAMERLGKGLGLPLAVLEALGRTEAACDAFLTAALTRKARQAHAPRMARLSRAARN